MSGKWGTSSNGKLVIYQGTEQIKYIKDNGDQNGIAREESYKSRIGEKWFWVGIKDISMKYVMNLNIILCQKTRNDSKNKRSAVRVNRATLKGLHRTNLGLVEHRKVMTVMSCDTMNKIRNCESILPYLE